LQQALLLLLLKAQLLLRLSLPLHRSRALHRRLLLLAWGMLPSCCRCLSRCLRPRLLLLLLLQVAVVVALALCLTAPPPQTRG
jgi:hypothetical protein